MRMDIYRLHPNHTVAETYRWWRFRTDRWWERPDAYRRGYSLEQIRRAWIFLISSWNTQSEHSPFLIPCREAFERAFDQGAAWWTFTTEIEAAQYCPECIGRVWCEHRCMIRDTATGICWMLDGPLAPVLRALCTENEHSPGID